MRRGASVPHFIVLAAYAAIWTLYGVIAKACQDMQIDAAEIVAWSHHLAFGYAKHPPLAAWLVRLWFTVFPIRDWSYYLFAILYAASGLWLAWRLYRRLLTPDKRIVALACLTFVPYFNFHGLRFDHNAVLGPLWAATALCFIRSYDTRAPLWAALAGAAAAAAMLGKYWSIFLLAGLALAAITDVRRTTYFRSPAPWITIAVGALLLAPHFVWLVQHDFLPLTYAIGAHGAKTFGQTLVTAGHYLAGGAGYAAVPALAVLVLTRPGVAALRDTLLPAASERRFVAAAFWTTFLDRRQPAASPSHRHADAQLSRHCRKAGALLDHDRAAAALRPGQRQRNWAARISIRSSSTVWRAAIVRSKAALAESKRSNCWRLSRSSRNE